MWEITISNQIETGILSILLGIFCAFIYDFLRSISVLFKKKIFVAFADILFCFIFSIITFIFLLSRTNGEIRGYVLFCEFSSFLIIRSIFSFFIIKYLSLFFSKINVFILLIDRQLFALGQKSCKISKKTLKSITFFVKKLLKNISGILYNIKVKKERKRDFNG